MKRKTANTVTFQQLKFSGGQGFPACAGDMKSRKLRRTLCYGTVVKHNKRNGEMNSTFKIVFNRARGAMTVVNEMTKSHQTGRKAAVAVAVAGALAFSTSVQAYVYVEAQGQDKTVTQAHVVSQDGDRVVGGWSNWSEAAEKAALNNTVTVKSGDWGMVLGGHYTSGGAEVDHSAVQNTHVVINGGTVSKSVVGGTGGTDNQKLVRHNKTAVASVTINGGSFGTAQPTTDCTELFVLGGDLMKHKGDNGGGNINAYAESEIGATHVTIKGGTFNSAVVGGSAAIVYYGNANKGAKTTVGTTNVTIEGGTFNHAIVAGGLASGHRTHSFVTEANLSVIAKDKDLAVNDSIFAGGVRRMDSFGGSGGSVEVKHATVRVEDVNVKGGIYGTSASLKMLTEKVQVDGKEKEKITGWEFKPLEIDGAVATVLTDMTLVNVIAKESILGEKSTLNVHGKVELGELKAKGVKISLFDAPANTPKVQTFAEDVPQTGTQLNLGTLTGTGNSFYFATSDASVNIAKNGNENTPDADKPLIDSITGSGSVNDDVAGDLNELASMVTVGGTSGAEVLKNTDLKLESGDVFGETTGTINKEGKLEDVKTSVNMNNVRIAEFAMRTPMQIARIESNDLRKRLGDIRSSEGATGVWARYDGGRFSGGEFENKFNKVQVGADTALAAYGSRLGLSFSYTQGDADMSGISADTDAYSLAAYGMWFGEAGQFADVIGRVGTVDTDLATRTYKTNYDQLMLSLSGEFGWRFDLTDTFYAEPSAELTYTRVDGETFKANSNTLGIDDYDSMVGRIGATAGLNCSQGRGGVYARFGVAHEFMGDGRFTAVNAAGTAADPIEVDGKDTWVEYAVGANFNITKQTYVWADLERTSGAEVDEDWRATIGVRHAF